MGVYKKSKVENGLKCEMCGKPLYGRQLRYCSYDCRKNGEALVRKTKLEELDAIKAQEEDRKRILANIERREKEEAMRKRAAEIERRKRMCESCVWKRNGICVMPTCMRKKGIGQRYEG